jgi:hypothetical protein
VVLAGAGLCERVGELHRGSLVRLRRVADRPAGEEPGRALGELRGVLIDEPARLAHPATGVHRASEDVRVEPGHVEHVLEAHDQHVEAAILEDAADLGRDLPGGSVLARCGDEHPHAVSMRRRAARRIGARAEPWMWRSTQAGSRPAPTRARAAGPMLGACTTPCPRGPFG